MSFTGHQRVHLEQPCDWVSLRLSTQIDSVTRFVGGWVVRQALA